VVAGFLSALARLKVLSPGKAGDGTRSGAAGCALVAWRRRHGLVDPTYELSVDARQIEEAQLRVRAQARIFQHAGDGRVQGVDVDQDQLLEGLRQLDERQVEGMPGPENHGQLAALRPGRAEGPGKSRGGAVYGRQLICRHRRLFYLSPR
jgi:hypothetical protein